MREGCRGLELASGFPQARDMGTPTDSNDEQDNIARRMVALGITEADLEESFVRSGGHGGQNVNKVATCVQLTHKPSGLQVKCQTTRHQGQNRVLARTLLLDKIEAARRERHDAERARIEKLRRQKRGRSKGAKLRNLADKARRSTKKSLRRMGRDE